MLDQQKKVENPKFHCRLPSPFSGEGFPAMRPSTTIIKQELRNEAIFEFNLQHLRNTSCQPKESLNDLVKHNNLNAAH